LSATLSADPDICRRRERLVGEIPSPLDLPRGCLFAGRCSLAVDACRACRPPLTSTGDGHLAACVRAEVPHTRALHTVPAG
jgi:oligopeptide transport system ATP-binding protein